MIEELRVIQFIDLMLAHWLCVGDGGGGLVGCGVGVGGGWVGGSKSGVVG